MPPASSKCLLLIVSLSLLFAGRLAGQSAPPNPCTAPPIPALDIPYETRTVEPGECGKLIFASGTTVCVPPNSLVDANGQPVKGPVTIYYRELHTPGEMIRSGTKMTLGAQRNAPHLESAGMFEIQAAQKEEPVYLRENTKLDVRMRSYSQMPNPEFFRYDCNQQTWKAQDEPVRVSREAAPKPATGIGFMGEVASAEDDPETFTTGFDEGDFSDDFGGDWVGDYEVDTAWAQQEAFREEVFMEMGISAFGFYNCDRQMEEENPVIVKASFEIAGEPEPENLIVYVVYKGLNSVISFSPESPFYEFYLLPNQPYRLVAIHSRNKMAVFDTHQLLPEEVENYRNKAFTFRLTPVPDNQTDGSNSYQLAQTLGFY